MQNKPFHPHHTIRLEDGAVMQAITQFNLINIQKLNEKKNTFQYSNRTANNSNLSNIMQTQSIHKLIMSK